MADDDGTSANPPLEHPAKDTKGSNAASIRRLRSFLVSNWRLIAAALVLLVALFLTSLYTFLLFHSLIEVGIAVTGFSVFLVAATSRRYLENNYLLFVGLAFLPISFLGLVHMLAFDGMGVFGNNTANLATQLWLATRYLGAAALLIAPMIIYRKMNWTAVTVGFCSAAALLIALIFLGYFPTAYTDATGLTPFKIYSEYAISIVLGLSMIVLYTRRSWFEKSVFQLVIGASALQILAELTFTGYVKVNDPVNMLGHLLILASFGLLLIALVRTGIEKPYALVFRSLKASETALREERDFANSIINNTQAVVMVVDRGGTILTMNPFGQRLLGANERSMRGSNWISAMIPVEEGEACRTVFQNAANGSETVHYSGRMITQSNQERWMSWSMGALKNDVDEVAGVLLLGNDMTELRRLEGELVCRAEELSRSNDDLQRFAYVASHDLREPLRMISVYLELLNAKHGGELDAEAKEYISIATEGAGRMREMIDGLLNLSRVDTRGAPMNPESLETSLQAALTNLGPSIDEAKARVARDPMPIARIDPTQMTQVFQNLIGNALKFRRDVPPSIQISARQTGTEWVISVADNGIGISKESQPGIFDLFNRVNPDLDYPGAGIGLATCKKIVERHGGKIWVESEVGKGSTFFFSLPDLATTGAV
ncbi:MAG TPA: MASE3 domain-containing protein [Methanomassiliicoccales archaeon]|nr:MASE3 domain-containing protein [Methanomassiliicoccales archaeon]